MKPVSYYLERPLPDYVEHFLDNLTWDEKFEFAVAISQRALDEKRHITKGTRRGQHAA